MKRIGKFGRLSAWALWFWIGVGLYCHWPQVPGPVVCKLAMEPDEQVMGFHEKRHEIVVRRSPSTWSLVQIPSGRRFAFSGKEILQFNARASHDVFSGSRIGVLLDRRQGLIDDDQRLPFGIVIPEGWRTVAIIDERTGKVVAREWRRQFREYPFISSDESMVASLEGTVRRHPGIDVLALCLCQAVIAAPIVFLCSAARFKQRRGA